MKYAFLLPVFSMPLLFLSGCGVVAPAQMVLPVNVQLHTAEHPVAELGGGTRGRFQVAAHSGTFRRSETRLEIFDVLDFRSGSAGFTLTGPLLEGQIDADCNMRERILNLGNFSFTPKRMAYFCDFTVDGRNFPARFEIQEAREGLAGALMKRERRGEIALDRVILQIQSVHELQGTRLQLATPIGYLFLLDAKAIAAIELNGRPRLFLPITDDVPLQRAVIAAALALALFWDPADSLL